MSKTGVLESYLREIIYGGIDGIVTTFAVVAGFSGAQIFGQEMIPLTFAAVLLFGFANLVADGLSMGLGNYLSVRADKDLYLRRKSELEKLNELQLRKRLEDTIEAMKLEQGAGAPLVQALLIDRELTVKWILENSEGLRGGGDEDPRLTGFATFLSFIVFGAIPIIPYALLDTEPLPAFLITITFTLGALLALGVMRWRISKVNLRMSMIETVGLGSLAAVAAFVVGTLFA